MAVSYSIAHARAFRKIGPRIGRMVASLMLALGLMIVSAGAAQAADAFTTADVSMRAGPSTDYPRVMVLRAGTSVTVYGCLQDYRWCDASFQNARGWVAATYLSYPYQGNRVTIPAFGAQLGLAILNFSLNDYWGSYYRNRPWYGRRDYWNRHPARPEYIRPGFSRPPRPRPPSAVRPPSRPKPTPGIRPPRPGHGSGGKPPRPKPDRPKPDRPGNGSRPPPKPGQGNGNRPGQGNGQSPGQGSGNNSRPTTQPAPTPQSQ